MYEFWFKDTVHEFKTTYGYMPPIRFILERYEADKRLGLI